MTNQFISSIKFAFIVLLSAPLAFSAAATATGDRVAVPLSDPSRPAFIKAHLLNGSITVKG